MPKKLRMATLEELKPRSIVYVKAKVVSVDEASAEVEVRFPEVASWIEWSRGMVFMPMSEVFKERPDA